MWHGYEYSLARYSICACRKWRELGYNDNQLDFFLDIKERLVLAGAFMDYPYWLGNKDFHASHRSNLLRKHPTFYKKHGWTDPDDLPYMWPAQGEHTTVKI